MKYYSQNGEDFLLAKLFAGKDDGVFVEVGCIDGRRFSNTLLLEEAGWKGMCVEAHEGYIELLKRNRPNCIIAHCAAGNTDEDDVTFYSNSRGSLSTLDPSLEEHFRKNYADYFSGFVETKVSKRRLDSLFKEYGIDAIDVLSIDIEGTEVETLGGIDFNIYRPSVILVEADSPEDEDAVDGILLSSGYHKAFRLGSNIFYVTDRSLAEPPTGKRFELELTHTRHPLDEGEDKKVKTVIELGVVADEQPDTVSVLSRAAKMATGIIRNAARTAIGRSPSGHDGAEPSRLTLMPTGFHGDRYLLGLVDAVAKKCEYFIETGANVGSTLAYTARTYPGLRCLSCEPDPEAFGRAVENTAGLGNVALFNEMSQEFIVRLKGEYKTVLDANTLFWLDAHGYGFKWPLMDELEFITSEFKSGYILIDDLKVPGLDCFLYDEYQGQICSLDFVKGSLDPGKAYRVYYPAYKDKTSQHHPLVGWGLIEFGHAEGLAMPEFLKGKVREVENVQL